jgi:hypothetical protein
LAGGEKTRRNEREKEKKKKEIKMGNKFENLSSRVKNNG